MKTYAILLSLLMLCGCSKSLSLSEDPVTAAREIETIIPIGTPKEKAEKLLSEAGITFREAQGTFGAEDIGKYIYGDYSESKNFITKRWQVALILEADRVSQYRVTFGLIGP
jgi:hypothetical protein